jgi:hypothetical protein
MLTRDLTMKMEVICRLGIARDAKRFPNRQPVFVQMFKNWKPERTL